MSKRILVEDQEDLRAILRDFLSASGYIQSGPQTVAPTAHMIKNSRYPRPKGCIIAEGASCRILASN
jgi:hypothetical protein